jgi:3-deoxy-D-manno-octulosonic-acid transferase
VFLLIYQIFWTLAMVAIAPVALLLGNRRFRERIVPDLPTEALPGGSIWIHALSVGEVISALPLVESLSERHPNRVIVFTVTTSKGMAVARNALRGRVGVLLFMPLDFWWSIRRVVQWIRPSVFLLVETDLWPGILGCLQGQGTPSILVNGRISPRTLRAYRRFPVFVREVFRFLEECLMQSDLDVQRLVEVGVDPSKVKAVGNIKFDRWWEPMGTEERAHWMESLCLNPQNVVWVAGSTHRGEEEIILRTFGRLRPAFPNLRLIIAPRQVEQADEIPARLRKWAYRRSFARGWPKRPPFTMYWC